MARQFAEMRSEATDFRTEVARQFADVRSEATDFRTEVARQFGEVRSEATDFRKEMAQQLSDLRQDIRHSLMAMIGFTGVLAAILVAFIQYRLGSG